MSAQALIDRLTKVKQLSRGRWVACCPAHDDSNPSLNVTEMDDGKVLMICRTGCGNDAILDALGLEFDVMFPDKGLTHHSPKSKNKFSAAQALEVLAFEASVVLICAHDLAKGVLRTESHERLKKAVERITAAQESTRG